MKTALASTESSDKYTLSNNLIHLLKKHGLTASSLAKSLGLPYNTIRRIVDKGTLDPKLSTLKLIAEYFTIPLDALTSPLTAAGYNGDVAIPKCVPVLTWEKLSKSNWLDDDELHKWKDWHPVALSNTQSFGKKAFAIRSRPSMQPRLPNNSILIIDPDETPRDGDTLLIRIKPENSVTVRDLVIDPPNWQLLPIIPNSPPLIYSKEKHEIVGTVVLTMLYKRQ